MKRILLLFAWMTASVGLMAQMESTFMDIVYLDSLQEADLYYKGKDDYLHVYRFSSSQWQFDTSRLEGSKVVGDLSAAVWKAPANQSVVFFSWRKRLSECIL